MSQGDATLKEELRRQRAGRRRGGHSQGTNGASANGNGQPKSNGHANGNGRSRQAVRDATSRVAAEMLVAADPLTAEHSEEVELLVEQLSERLGVDGEERDTVLLAARLHDVGKVAIPLSVLEKPGALDRAEWQLIKKHTLVGERIVASVPELSAAAVLVRHSHEHFDGSGYPDGLSGEEIPLGSRIVLCADAFHAIRCDRPYRGGRSSKEAFAEVEANSGKQFDPKVVRALSQTIAAARTPMVRRMPKRVAVLLATLAIGTGGAYAAERGWIPSPIPGIGPEKSSDAGSAPSDATAGTASATGSISTEGGAGEADGGTDRSIADLLGGGAAGKRDGRNLDPLGVLGAALLGEKPGGGGGEGGLSKIVDEIVGVVGSPGEGGSAGGSAGGGSSGAGPGPALGGPSAGGPGNSGRAPGNSGDAPGQGGSGPGNSGDAPGQGGSSPGNSGDAPGQGGSSPGNSGSAPGQGGSSPGNSGSAPGNSGGAPGNSGVAPGNSGSAPGNSGLAPGNSGSAPGNIGLAPGNSGSAPSSAGGPPAAPGNSGSAPGHNRP